MYLTTLLPAFHTLQPIMARKEYTGQYALSAEKFAVGYSLRSIRHSYMTPDIHRNSLNRIRKSSSDYVIRKHSIKSGAFVRDIYILSRPQETNAIARNLGDWLLAPVHGEIDSTLRERFVYGPSESMVAWWSLTGDFIITLDVNTARRLALSLVSPNFLEAKEEHSYPRRRDLRNHGQQFPKQRPTLVGIISLFRL